MTTQAKQYTFPEGNHIGRLEVSNGTVLEAGSIPDHITELNMRESSPLFRKGAIHSGIKYLTVDDLAKDSYYPSTLEHLIIRNYSGKLPLPTGLCAYVHAIDRNNAGNQEHYLFRYNCDLGRDQMANANYDHGPQIQFRAFNESYKAVKRTPKVKAHQPALVKVKAPESPVPVVRPITPINDQLQLIKAKQELVREKTKLVQAQLELVTHTGCSLRSI